MSIHWIACCSCYWLRCSFATVSPVSPGGYCWQSQGNNSNNSITLVTCWCIFQGEPLFVCYCQPLHCRCCVVGGQLLHLRRLTLSPVYMMRCHHSVLTSNCSSNDAALCGAAASAWLVLARYNESTKLVASGELSSSLQVVPQPDWAFKTAGLQSLYSEKASPGTHTKSSAQWLFTWQ